jgi:arylsulfatase A-like enzyme
MLASFDEAVGSIVDALRARGLERRTLVALASDNGCVTHKSTCRNAPLRGGKGLLLEGGIRVPFLLSWPGTLPAGESYARPVSTLDLFPTFLAAATGGTYRNARLDGVDLAPFLTGEAAGDPHAHLFWGGQGGRGAVRGGPWKLALEGGARALHDLPADVGEARDVAARQSAVVGSLQAAHAAWARQLQPPLWPPAPP